MDPVTILLVAFLALAAVAVSLIAFKTFFKETNFEEAYGASALRLLSEEKGGKQKAGKANKNKTKASERKKDKDSGSEKETKPEKEPSPVPEPIVVAEEPKQVDVSPEAKQKKKNKNKHPASGEMKHPEVESPVVQKTAIPVEQAAAKAVPTPVSEATTPDEPAAADGVATKAKKKRARRSSEHQKDQQNPVKEEAQHAHSEVKAAENSPSELPKEEKKVEKPKPKKPTLLVKDINVDRLHTRLCAVSDLEPEYLSFLASYLSDTGAQKTKFTEEIGSLRKQIADKERVVLQCTEKLNNALKKDAEIVQLQHAIAEEKKKYALFEQSVRSQMTNGIQERNNLQRSEDQLKSENCALKEELKKAQAAIHAAPPVDTTAFQQQIDILTTELKAAKNGSSQLEAELRQRMQVLQQLQHEAQSRDRQVEHLNQSIAAVEKRANEIEETAREDEQNWKAKLQDSMKLMEDLQNVSSKIREDAIQQAASEKANLEHEIQALKQQVANVEMEREEARRDVVSSHLQVNNMEAEHHKALSSLGAKNEENQAINDKLNHAVEELAKVHNQLAVVSEEKKLAADLLASATKELEITKEGKQKMQADLEAAHARLEDASKSGNASDAKKGENAEEPVTISLVTADLSEAQEVMEVKSVQNLASSAPSEGDLDKLKRELADQQRRNNDLRETNYKVMEISQKQEQSLMKRIGEVESKYEQTLREYRSETAKALSSALPPTCKLPAMPNPCDTKQYCEWLTEAKQTLKNATVASKATTSAHHEKKHAPKKESSPAQMREPKDKHLEETVEKYRAALAAVSSSMEVVELEAARKEKAYEQEIAHLKKEVAKQILELKKQLSAERESGRQLSDQAVKLRGILRNGHEGVQEAHQVVGRLRDEVKNEPDDSGRRSVEEEWEVVDDAMHD